MILLASYATRYVVSDISLASRWSLRYAIRWRQIRCRYAERGCWFGDVAIDAITYCCWLLMRH